MASNLVFWVPPPRISEPAVMMSLALWSLRRPTHLQLQRCECSPACKRGSQYIAIRIKEQQ